MSPLAVTVSSISFSLSSLSLQSLLTYNFPRKIASGHLLLCYFSVLGGSDILSMACESIINLMVVHFYAALMKMVEDDAFYFTLLS